ncbi:acyl-CoA carboxylase epsilon subunit [Saccharothrix sp. NRRL B-16314]|uniref:acyl-CoA carboxylase epsilon subunit n=1 Tax=Saccharothrix sp. NRRL B-16314 TaxID=1463825 RepID=UPI0012DC7149|nr:acyl-CoA carboxylase epsilon subunit [Saccharothrix sp. NRRL B-16314]
MDHVKADVVLLRGAPTDEELAALVAALAAVRDVPAPPPTTRVPAPWTAAGRYAPPRSWAARTWSP